MIRLFFSFDCHLPSGKRLTFKSTEVSKFTVKEFVKRIFSIFLFAKTQAFWNGTSVYVWERASSFVCLSPRQPPSWFALWIQRKSLYKYRIYLRPCLCFLDIVDFAFLFFFWCFVISSPGKEKCFDITFCFIFILIKAKVNCCLCLCWF